MSDNGLECPNDNDLVPPARPDHGTWWRGNNPGERS